MSEQAAKPPIVDQETWRKELDELRRREKAATRELDAIAAQRRRLPMVEMADYTLIGEDGPVRLADVFKGRSQLIVYNHMWEDGAEWQAFLDGDFGAEGEKGVDDPGWLIVAIRQGLEFIAGGSRV